MATGDLFESGTAPDRAKAPGSGFLVTNHLNLMYMLSAGIVMPPAGFGAKYYRDTLGCFPGWVPLFIGKVPGEAIESSTREAGHLRPTIVEIGLTSLSGRVLALGEDGLRELRFPDRLDASERAILVPAPLPTSWIASVIFGSPEDKRACEADAKDFGNVPLQDFKRKAVKTLFTKASDTPWPPTEGPEPRSAPLQASLAAGGVMAMLLLVAHRGPSGVRVCRHAFDPEDDSAPPVEDPILAGLRGWMLRGAASSPATSDTGTGSTDPASAQNLSRERLFWGAVERLVDWKDAGGTGSAEEVLLDYLEAASSRLEPRLQARARKLHHTLVSLGGLADATTSEVFDRHPWPLARAFTLFFLRRDCADLLDFSNERLVEPDWLAAALLFGVRDGWSGLPLRLRAIPGLPAAVSHRMARMAHRLAGTGLDLGEPPVRVRPLRELFGDASAWGARERAAALELARGQRWDCIHTRVSLGRGEYTLTVQAGSVHIDLPGEPGITPEIDPTRFFDHLAGTRIGQKVETRVRKALQR